MIVLINSSKTLDFAGPGPVHRPTTPEFQPDAAILVEHLQKHAVQDLMQLMGISKKLAQVNARRYAEWQEKVNAANARPALWAYKGDVYSGLAVEDYSPADWQFAQAHLRILAGLYGLLRPLDLIQPYRLEMATKLTNPRGENLYAFWGRRITQSLKRALQETGANVLVNLASQEYFKAIDLKILDAAVITPLFKQRRGGKLKTIAIYTKKARGLMCDFIIRHRLTDVGGIKDFSGDGYRFDPQHSSRSEWLFLRE